MPKKPAAPVVRAVGRPAIGKRSNPDYRQTSLWLKKETLGETQRRLIRDDGTRVDLAVIVQNLLEQWLKAGGKVPRNT